MKIAIKFSILLAISSFSFSQSVDIKDGDSNSLITINDEGDAGSITIPDATALVGAPTTDKLYNESGTLKWDGTSLGTGGSSLWTENGSNIYYNSGNVGIGTTSPSANLHVNGDNGIVVSGTWNSGTIPTEGAGERMMWYPKKAAFRAGRIDGTQWNDNLTGNYSIATGYSTTASGGASTALGNQTTADGTASIAMGYSTIASGDYSTAIGREIQASNDYTVAIALNDQNGTNVTQANTMAIMGGTVGIGTISPDRKLTVIGNVTHQSAIYGEAFGPATAVRGNAPESGVPNMINYGGRFTAAADLGIGVSGFAEHGSGVNYGVKGKTNSSNGWAGYFEGRGYFSGNVGIADSAPTHLLDVGSSGAYCDGGAWVTGSSREYKENIAKLALQEAKSTLAKLEPVKYNYKTDLTEEYIGFIAEDVPELVATKDRKGLSPMDIVAVLVRVTQEQQKQIDELKTLLERKIQ